MCDKIAISGYILKIVENDPILRPQMRAMEMFNHHEFFPTNKQYIKIKLMQNETNLWSIFMVNIWNTKTEKIPNVTSKFLSHVRIRLLNMTWSNLRFNA